MRIFSNVLPAFSSIPLGSTVPFFLLVVAELAFLVRAIALTLWPSLMVGGDDDTETDDPEDPSRGGKQKRSAFTRYCCCFLRWKLKFLLQAVNFLVLLNPFFGCVIAWILMYQSDKTESFIVLGLEGASLILHFASVWLEGSFQTCKQIAFHCIPLVPFFISIGLIFYYLKQGGVVSPFIPDVGIFCIVLHHSITPPFFSAISLMSEFSSSLAAKYAISLENWNHVRMARPCSMDLTSWTRWIR